jgi:hypothetical protein
MENEEEEYGEESNISDRILRNNPDAMKRGYSNSALN